MEPHKSYQHKNWTDVLWLIVVVTLMRPTLWVADKISTGGGGPGAALATYGCASVIVIGAILSVLTVIISVIVGLIYLLVR